jgi:hypothetical protein
MLKHPKMLLGEMVQRTRPAYCLGYCVLAKWKSIIREMELNCEQFVGSKLDGDSADLKEGKGNKTRQRRWPATPQITLGREYRSVITGCRLGASCPIQTLASHAIHFFHVWHSYS